MRPVLWLIEMQKGAVEVLLFTECKQLIIELRLPVTM
jgi:hypothetical protein